MTETIHQPADSYSIKQRRKEAVHERDGYECANCGATDDSTVLDVHHVVPRGSGGSNRYSNLVTLCRRCHDAVHNDEMAPTIQTTSSGRMGSEEFKLYKELFTTQLPELAATFGVVVQPIFHDESGSWHVAKADLEALYGALADSSHAGEVTVPLDQFF